MMNAKNPSDRSAQHVDAMSRQDRLTDVDRYLLDDPSLDREAFELRMADDLELCEQVAQAVDQLHLMGIAAKSLDATVSVNIQPSAARSSAKDHTWLYAIAAIATAILIGVFGLSPGRPSKNDSASDQRLAMLAESWLDASLESNDEAINATGIPVVESTASTDIESDSEANDWLFDAAREYFLENQNGVAG
jgi:hypothetical protein